MLINLRFRNKIKMQFLNFTVLASLNNNLKICSSVPNQKESNFALCFSYLQLNVLCICEVLLYIMFKHTTLTFLEDTDPIWIIFSPNLSLKV